MCCVLCAVCCALCAVCCVLCAVCSHNPAFLSFFVSFFLSGLRSFTPRIEEEYDGYVASQGWRDAGPEGVEIDMMTMMSELVMASTGRCLLGKGAEQDREGTVELETLTNLYHALDEGLSAMAFIMPGWIAGCFPSVRRQCRAREQLEAFFIDVANKRKKQRDAGQLEADEPGFLEKIQTTKYKNGNAIQDWEVGRLMIAAMFAGQHTSSIAGAYAGLHIANGSAEFKKTLMKEQRGWVAPAIGDGAEAAGKEGKEGKEYVGLEKDTVDPMKVLHGTILERCVNTCFECGGRRSLFEMME